MAVGFDDASLMNPSITCLLYIPLEINRSKFQFTLEGHSTALWSAASTPRKVCLQDAWSRRHRAR